MPATSRQGRHVVYNPGAKHVESKRFVDRTRQTPRDHGIKMWQKWFTSLVPLMMLGVASAKPNIVIFVVDDLGISDLGCFGNDTIKTPNIDRLAEQGARLQHDVTPDAICTPNRAALLTGRYPIRSGLASDEGQDRVFLHTAASGGLPQNETTFAEIASAAGYKTGWCGLYHVIGLHYFFFLP